MPTKFVGLQDNEPQVFTVQEPGDRIQDRVSRPGQGAAMRRMDPAALRQRWRHRPDPCPGGVSILHVWHGDRNGRGRGGTDVFANPTGKHAVIVGVGQHWSGDRNRRNVCRPDRRHREMSIGDGDVLWL